MTYTILLAEDDKDIAKLVTLYLTSSGYRVLTAGNGREAWDLFQDEAVDLAVLDLMMPQMDGYELIRKIRISSNLPIIVLSAKNTDQDKILGLNIGADDYITKPFNPLEITARVQSSLRRYYKLGSHAATAERLELGELILDSGQRQVTKAGKELPLTETEFRLLQTLMAAPGRVFTKLQLAESVSGSYLEADDKTIVVHISNLRSKIEADSKHPDYIKTIKGVGYKIEKKT